MRKTNNLTREEVIEITNRYPYLLPRNVWTDKLPDDYDYTYIRYLEIPDGWNELFSQLCEDIRQPLIDAKYLKKFRFIQVKEKYNRLECYNLGAPTEVHNIIRKYSMMARHVCTCCGRPAEYETQGYIASYCEKCLDKIPVYERIERIKFDTNFRVITRIDGKEQREMISFKNEWERYLNKVAPDVLAKGTKIKVGKRNGVIDGTTNWHGKLAYLVLLDGCHDYHVLKPDDFKVIEVEYES